MSDVIHLASLSQGDFADLTVEGRREQWRVNMRFEVGTGDDTEGLLSGFLSPAAEDPMVLSDGTVGMVFQQADAAHEWLVVTVLQETEGEFEFGKAAFADTGGATEEFDDPEIEVHSIAWTKEDLEGYDA